LPSLSSSLSLYREDRCDDEDVIEGGYIKEDVDILFSTMMRQRARESPVRTKVTVPALTLPKERTADRDLELSAIISTQKTEEKADELIAEPEEELEEG
jgi:hypothetical protein